MSRFEGQVPLINSLFPLLTRYSRQSALVAQQDVITPEDQQNRDLKPAPIYLENLLPTKAGYRNTLQTPLPFPQTIDEIDFPIDINTKYLFLRDALDNVTQMWISGDKACYYNASVFIPTVIASPGSVMDGEEITYAYLKDQTYIFFPRIGCFVFDIGTSTFQNFVMQGLDFEKIKGIVAASGYLVAYDADTIYYSSVVTPTDFIPSTTTGAGSTKILGLAGAITGCLPLDNGFIIYTSGNAVAASYSGNALLPFVFKEIKGSAGLIALKGVAWQPAIPYHIAFSSVGLLQLDKNQAVHVFPEITDFLASGILESIDFDPTLGIFSQFTSAKSEFNIALNYILNRYLTISYGPTSSTHFTHALVYDLSLQRWGKLKIDHVSLYAVAILGDFHVITYLDLQALGTTWDSLHADGTIYLDWFRASQIKYFPDQILGYLRPVLNQNHDWGVVETDIPADTLSGPPRTGFIIFGDYRLTSHKTITLYESRIDTLTLRALSKGIGIASYIKNLRTVSYPEVSTYIGDGNVWNSRIVGEYFEYAIGGDCALDLSAFSTSIGRANSRR